MTKLHQRQSVSAVLGTLLTLALQIAAVSTSTCLLRAAEGGPKFNRDIRPILSDNCLQCHGPDGAKRKAGLRIDTQEGIAGKTRKGNPIVVSGKASDSELWKRISSNDPDYQMPPRDSGKSLTAAQQLLLRQWIDAGGRFESHWSLMPPERPAVPAVKDSSWGRNLIDAFILNRLEGVGLKPAPEADRRILARRLALDLTGLPPAPELVESFVKDRSENAYAKLVDRLFKSEHYGEHRARYWLDAARYADTHGLHFDNYREMWPYRDWVIKAFNANMRFDRFTELQLAGDLLPDAGQDELVATGFHRCNVTTNEGGTIEEENLANYARDRVETTSAVWLGLTANCASCHDHKFDPISMKDFYSMAAFFRNTAQGGFDGNVKNSSPSIPVIHDRAKWKRWLELQDELGAARKRVDEKRKDIDKAFEAWVAQTSVQKLSAPLEQGLIARLQLNDGETNKPAGTLRGRKIEGKVSGAVTLRKEGKFGPALSLQKGAGVEFAQIGDVSWKEPFTISAWVYIPGAFNDEATLLSRMEAGPRMRGWDFWHEQGQLAVHLVDEWPHSAIKLRTVNRVARRGGWQLLTVTSDGSGNPEGFRFFFDGTPQEMEIHKAGRLKGNIKTSAPLRIGRRTGGEVLDGISVQDVRVYSRELPSHEVYAMAKGYLADYFNKPFKDWKDEDKKTVKDFFFNGHYDGVKTELAALRKLENERRGALLNNPVTHVQQEKKNSEPMAHVLFRGQYDKPRDKVGAGTFAVLHAMPEGAPKNRLGLAKWLVAPENPLMARVTVNRMWQELFGVGLVKTADDFGVMGEAPVNQALLDWLAVEFRESGWNIQHMYRLMVTSAAYRQAATTTPEKIEKDPANRLVSRGPRFRMDAEMIRDYALAVGGVLVPRLGGESVRPYQPDGVWEAVAMPESNTRYYRKDFGQDLYRRSLYTFWKRAAPPANMDILNAPSREVCTVRRERTNTPLQALVTLNDPQFIEAARNLADQAARWGKGRESRAIDYMARRILLRPLAPEEAALVEETYAAMLKHYTEHPEDAARLTAIGEIPLKNNRASSQIAALTMVANQLLNTDEALNK